MSDRNRRVTAFIVGASFGFLYTLVAQYINVWTLPGIPLHEPAIGREASVVISTLFMGAFSMIVLWERESLWGLLIASLAGVVITSIGSFLNAREDEAFKSLIVFTFTFLPRVVLFLPLGLFLRWAVSNIEAGVMHTRGSLRRFLLVFGALVLVAGLGGRFSLYQEEALIAIRDAHDLLLAGMAVDSRDELPEALQPVEGFVQYANGPYTLEWSSDVDSLPVQRPRASLATLESLIIYHFENGYVFGCTFTPPSYKANCIHISRIPPR